MRREYVWGGLAVAGLAAVTLAPRLWPKARLTLRRAVAAPYVSGTPGIGRATANPTRGQPA